MQHVKTRIAILPVLLLLSGLAASSDFPIHTDSPVARAHFVRGVRALQSWDQEQADREGDSDRALASAQALQAYRDVVSRNFVTVWAALARPRAEARPAALLAATASVP